MAWTEKQYRDFFKTLPPHINTPDAQALKRWGEVCETKVSFAFVYGHVFIHIMDFEFYTYADALNCLKEHARNIVDVPTGELLELKEAA